MPVDSANRCCGLRSHRTLLREGRAMPDWTEDNDYLWTDALSRREWAWEFLRRNSEFRADWNAAQVEYGVSGYDGGTTTMMSLQREPSLLKWGCLYTASPKYDARISVVF